MYIKIRGIGNWIPESATGPLLIRKISESDKIATFSFLSDIFFCEAISELSALL